MAALCVLLLASCGGRKPNQEFDPFVGLVVADEPQAAEAGQAIIAAGGNAADAAAAMYFTLAATLPSRASLGSGGVCTVFSPERKGAETLMFLPLAGSSGGVVPLGMRAMAALSARYGKLPWGMLLADAEQRARFGATVGEQLAQDLQSAEAGSNDVEFQRLFAPGGRRLGVGDQLLQPALADLLSSLRALGPNYSHSGEFVENFQRATQQAGLPVSAAEMRDSAPSFVPAVEIYLGGPTAYFSPPPAANGLVAAQLLVMLTDKEDFSDLEPLEAAHLFAEASATAFAHRGQWMAPNGAANGDLLELADNDAVDDFAFDEEQHRAVGQVAPVVEAADGAAFVAGDISGTMVACSLTMNGLFGSGRVAPGTGILLAAPPAEGRAVSPVAMILGSSGSSRSYMAAGSSGGAAGATSLVRVLLEAMLNERPLAEALAIGRVHHNGAPDAVFAESGLGSEVLQGLAALGHQVREAASLGRVTALYCPEAIERGTDGLCQAAPDPRGFGAALTITKEPPTP